MSCFKLPIGLSHDIKAMIWKFWWGQRGDRRKNHWKSWKSLCQPKSKGGMGFQELTKFNEAMLGKQVWRLIHDTDSLFYRVFKAKYFPNGSIVEARMKSGSYAWKSILRARKVINLGAKWRVGDGKFVHIFKDNWLPGEGNGRIALAPNLLNNEAVVSQLIDQDTKWWNSSLINQIFYPFEAEKIKSIPICSFTQPDLLFWPSTNYGNFVVKSGYHLLCADEDSELASSVSYGATSRSFWSRLWKMNVPNKVKTFMWGACSDSLPTLKKLVQNTIASSPLCASFLQAPKDVLHALWGCTNLLQDWSLDFKELVIVNCHFCSFA